MFEEEYRQGDDGGSNTLYIPNPDTWRKYYANLARGKDQVISSLGRRGNTFSMRNISEGSNKKIDIPLSSASLKSPTTGYKENAINLVAPSEQALDQAKSEIERNPDNVSRLAIEKGMRVKKLKHIQKGGSGRSTSRKRGNKKTIRRKKKTAFAVKKKKKNNNKRKTTPRRRQNNNNNIGKRRRSSIKSSKSLFRDIFN